MREDGARHPFGIPAALKLVAPSKRMVGRRLIALVVEIVKQRDDAPCLLVLTERPRVAAHGRFDGERVFAQALTLGPFGQQRPGGLTRQDVRPIGYLTGRGASRASVSPRSNDGRGLLG